VTDEIHERGAESSTAQAVDDEVDGRVGDDEQVAESLVVEERAGADEAAKVNGTDNGLRHCGRGLSHHEHDDDNDQHQGDVLLGARRLRPAQTPTAATAHARSLLPGPAQLDDETLVEKGEREERNEKQNKEIEQVLVDQSVDRM